MILITVDFVDADMDMQTTIKLMHLNGLRNRDEPQSPVNMTEEDDSGLLRRSKRSVKKNKLPPTCHTGQIYVNLTKYKNIILAPAGFHTHYCGNTYLVPVANDPIIQTLAQAITDAYKSVKKFSAKVLANPSCCAPKKFHNLYVLYVDQGFSTIKSIPNIKASRCACKNE